MEGKWVRNEAARGSHTSREIDRDQMELKLSSCVAAQKNAQPDTVESEKVWIEIEYSL